MRPRKKDRHLPPCVYFRHGAYWLVKAGKWERLGSDLGEALHEHARRMSEPTGGMSDLIDRALPFILKGKADNTQQQYQLASKLLKRKLAEFSPAQVKHHHMVKLADAMADTPNMANRVLCVARMIFNKAAGWGEVEHNPCIGVPRFEEGKRKRLLSDAEWHAIYNAAGPRLRVIMRLQHLTGQRIGDVLSIRRSQLTEDGIAFKQEKTDAALVVRWTPELRAVVDEAKTLNKTPALTLLRGKYGRAPDYRSVYEQWAAACDKAGVLDAKLNDGRAMSATAAKRQGKDAQALLGHTSASMTARYLRDRETPEVDGPTLPSIGQPIGRRR